MGAEGKQVYLLTGANIHKYQQQLGESLDEYLLQECIETDCEKRLILFGNELVAARNIRNRHHPWEDPSKVKTGQSKELYDPTEYEITIAKKVHAMCGMDYSCVDFIDSPMGPLLLEVNGVCPGLTYPTDERLPLGYNLGGRFAEFVLSIK